jgi:hypothetical protein
MPMLDEALDYLAEGLSVIPIHPENKRPYVKWEAYQKKLPTEGNLRKWWTNWPNANIGVVTGAVSGIWVVDIDDPAAASQWLKAQGIPLPDTPTVETAKGSHLWFRHPGHEVGNSAKKVPGIDIRGDGGYVIVPPSIHPSGIRYEWSTRFDREALAECPPALMRAVTGGGGKEKTPKAPAPQGQTPSEDPAQAEMSVDSADSLPETERLIYDSLNMVEGQRNTTMTQLVGRWVGMGHSPAEVRAFAHFINKTKCRPPMDGSEVDSIVVSIVRRDEVKAVRDQVGDASAVIDPKIAEAARESVLEGFSIAFGFPVVDLIKYRNQDGGSTYVMQSSDHRRVTTTDVKCFMSQNLFRALCAECVMRIPKPIEAKRWSEVAQTLLSAFTEVRVTSTDGTGLIHEWVEFYLEDQGMDEDCEKDWNTRCYERQVFRHHGFLHISTTEFMTWLRAKMNVMHSPAQVMTAMAMAGCEKRTLYPEVGPKGKRVKTARPVFVLPKRFDVQAVGEMPEEYREWEQAAEGGAAEEGSDA